MRISDWSSDVCSSDLCGNQERQFRFHDTYPNAYSSIKRACASVIELTVNSVLSFGQLSSRDYEQRHPLSRFKINASKSGRVRPPESVMRRPQERRSEEHKSELQSLIRHSYAVFCLKK